MRELAHEHCRFLLTLWLVLALPIIGALPACSTPEPSESLLFGATPRLPTAHRATAEDPFEPIPEDMGLAPAKVELGRRLFEDKKLSGDGTRNCADCHDLRKSGIVPGQARSGHPLNATGPYNVPTVFKCRVQLSIQLARQVLHDGGSLRRPHDEADGDERRQLAEPHLAS